MEIRQLRTFQTVAKLLSFNRAAELLHYAQSSVSAQIQALEEELNVKLFDRLGRSILLTEEGVHLLQYSEKIIALAETAKAELSNERELYGSLTIRIPETFGVYRLPAILDLFRSRFPKVNLHFTTCTHDGLKKDLRKGITDIAFLLTESIQTSDLCSEALSVESLVIVAHPEHPLISKPIVKTEDLAGESLLLSKVDCSYRKIFEQILETKGVACDNALEFNSVAAIKQCVRNGLGITIIPEVAVERDLAQGRLAKVPWEEDKLEVALLMIWFKEKWLSPTLTAFMDVTREVMVKLNKS